MKVGGKEAGRNEQNSKISPTWMDDQKGTGAETVKTSWLHT